MNPVGQNAWVLASRIAPQLGGVLLLVLGARFLDPATLGSFVLIFAWTELLRRLVRAGWREAVVMDTANEATPAVTTLACAAAVAALALVALSALALRHAGLDPAYVHCLLLLGASLLPVAPSVIWEGLLLRTRRTDLEAATVIAAEAAHLALAALLLAAGLGIAGLALARLVRALVAFAGLGWATGWPLPLSTDWRRAAAVLPVSMHVTLASLINFATTYGVDLVIGVWLGPASVAFFRVGSRIAGGVADVLNETVRVLGWSSLPARRPADTPADLAHRIDGFLGRTLELTAPVYVGLALVAAPLVALLMGPGWETAAGVVALMALARMLQIPAAVAWPALAAVGRTAALPRLAFLLAGLALAAMLVLGPFGLRAILWGQLAAALIGGAATVALVNREAFPVGARLSFPPDLAAGLALLAAAVTATGAATAALPPAAALALQTAAGGAAYAAFLRWRRPELAAEILAGLRPAREARR